MRRVLFLLVPAVLCGLLVNSAIAADTQTAVRIAARLPVQHLDRVLPHDTDIYTVHYWTGARVVIVVIGDGSSDLDLQIKDPFGRIMAFDFGPTDDCVCSFTAEYSGEYTIEVINRDAQSNVYLLARN